MRITNLLTLFTLQLFKYEQTLDRYQVEMCIFLQPRVKHLFISKTHRKTNVFCLASEKYILISSKTYFSAR